MSDKQPYLHKGQKLYKADGTVGAEMAYDVYEGHKLEPAHIKHMDMNPVREGDVIVDCVMDRLYWDGAWHRWGKA